MNDKGERIKQLRKELNITLEKFGEPLGVTKQTMSRLENGVNNLTEQMAKSICREYHVSYDWLIFGKGPTFEGNNQIYYNQIDKIMNGNNTYHKHLVKLVLNLDDNTVTKIKGAFDE